MAVPIKCKKCGGTHFEVTAPWGRDPSMSLWCVRCDARIKITHNPAPLLAARMRSDKN